jgi:hypothetical protein
MNRTHITLILISITLCYTHFNVNYAIGMDIIVRGLELAFHHIRQVTGGEGDDMSEGHIIMFSWTLRFRR